MAGKVYERRWPQVIQSFTANGGADGLVTVADAEGFFVKQKVTLSATGLDPLYLEIKRVESNTTLYVGPQTNDLSKEDKQQAGQSIDARTNISAFTTALSAQIFAYEQSRPNIADHYVIRHVYQEEPAVALRVLQVDQFGEPVGGSGGVASDVNVIKWGGAATSLGQKVMASSVPVVIASNQSPVPVTLDIDLEDIDPTFAELAAGSITGTTPGTANTIVTPAADKVIMIVRNTLNRETSMTVDGVKLVNLGANQGLAIELGTNGKKIASGSVIGIYHEGNQPNQGKIMVSLI